jgi:hypothetical protein
MEPLYPRSHGDQTEAVEVSIVVAAVDAAMIEMAEVVATTIAVTEAIVIQMTGRRDVRRTELLDSRTHEAIARTADTTKVAVVADVMTEVHATMTATVSVMGMMNY